MINATERQRECDLYKENFYVEGNKLFCVFCNCVIDHTKKSLLDQHLKTEKHKDNQSKEKPPRQLTLTGSINNFLNDRDTINKDLVRAFTQANIPLEKVDKLKPFLTQYCRNGKHILIIYIYYTYILKIILI
jgi:hypothetical protein